MSISENESRWISVTAGRATEVCARARLSADAGGLITADLTPPQFVEMLSQKGLYGDALLFLANALPKREAVWWACVCARSVIGHTQSRNSIAALEAAERWVRDTTEENRRVAFTAAEAAELSTPAGCAAMAAFWSGGSLSPPDAPVVSPPDHLTAHGVACAIQLTAVVTEPEKAREKYQRCLAFGIDIAKGNNRWK